MKCTAKCDEVYEVNGYRELSKDCMEQETCCDNCGYEDCMEGCDMYEILFDTCEGCPFVD